MHVKSVFVIAMCLMLSACGGKEAQKEFAMDAKMLLSETEATELLQYTPSASYDKSYTKSTVRYDSEPIGKDPLIVELYSSNDKMTSEDILEEFERKRAFRSDSVDITDYDAEAFLAYPSVNIYKDGYMAVVTAGSGADEAQEQLLRQVGKIVADNLNAHIGK